MTSDAQKAAQRLGVPFVKCEHCAVDFVWDPEETYSVTVKPPLGDYDDGTSDVLFCCSHVCASRKHATLPEGTGIIWRGGRCGGTSLPSLEEP